MLHINLNKFVHAFFIKINFTPCLLERNLSLCEDNLTDSTSSLPYHEYLVFEHMCALCHEEF